MQGFDRSAKFYNEMYVKAEEYEATYYGEFSFGRGTRIIYRGELFLNRNLVFFFFLFFFYNYEYALHEQLFRAGNWRFAARLLFLNRG